MFFEDSKFISKNGIRHGFFGRLGGVSKGIFSTLNCGIAAGDDPNSVRENRGRVMESLRAAPENLVTLHQIHSNLCMDVLKPWALDERPQADAMVTDRPGIALGVLTADCAPVLFYGEKQDGSPVIGAAHAGWGGALKGVLENTVAAMEKHGVTAGNVRATIGPCIGPESYEVKDDFAQPFIVQDPANSEFFRPGKRKGHMMFDLPAYAAYRLALLGVPHVSVTGIDTFFNEADYFSYRRSTHRVEPSYGRQLSVIAIAS